MFLKAYFKWEVGISPQREPQTPHNRWWPSLFAATSPGNSLDSSCTFKPLGNNGTRRTYCRATSLGGWEWRFVRMIIRTWLVNLQLFFTNWAAGQGFCDAPPPTAASSHPSPQASACFQPHPCPHPYPSLHPGILQTPQGLLAALKKIILHILAFPHFVSAFWVDLGRGIQQPMTVFATLPSRESFDIKCHANKYKIC